MKIFSYSLYCFLLFTGIASCNSSGKQKKEVNTSMHHKHSGLANDFTHKDIILLDQPYQVNDKLKGQFREIVEAYLQVSEALASDDTIKAEQAADQMFDKIKITPDDAFDGEGLKAWKQHAELYTDKLSEMKHIKGLENKRSYFGHISEIMYCTVRSFDISAQPLFAAYCPMAFDGKGAYWLTASKTIKNPYFGKAMLNCGAIKEEL